MFSSSYISVKVGLSLIILALMGTYSQHIGRLEDQQALTKIKTCVLAPSKCINQPLVMRVKIKTRSELSTRVQVKVGQSYLATHPIDVRGLTGQQSSGRIVDVLGSFADDRTFSVVRQREDDWIQTTKYVVSILGVGICLYLLLCFFTPTHGSLLPLSPRKGP